VLLPHLLSLNVDEVDYVKVNGRTERYLFSIVSLMLDQRELDIEMYETPDGEDVEDTTDLWKLAHNDDTPYEGRISVDHLRVWPSVILLTSLDIKNI
jgi:hypothetical protein